MPSISPASAASLRVFGATPRRRAALFRLSHGSAGRRWPEDRDLMMRPVRGDPLACPSIAVAGHQSIAVEDTGNQIIIGDEHQLADGRDDIAGHAVALSTAPLRQAQFSMDAANPMDQENDLGGFVIDIGDHLPDDGPRCAS